MEPVVVVIPAPAAITEPVVVSTPAPAVEVAPVSVPVAAEPAPTPVITPVATAVIEAPVIKQESAPIIAQAIAEVKITAAPAIEIIAAPAAVIAEPINLDKVLAESGLMMVQTSAPTVTAQVETPVVKLGRPRKPKAQVNPADQEPLVAVETVK